MKKHLFKVALIFRNSLRGSDFFKNDLQRNVIAYMVILAAIATTIISLIFDLFNKNTIPVIANVLAILGFSIGLYLMRKNHFSFAKLTVLCAALFSFMLSGSVKGTLSGLQYLWFPILSSIFVFFSFKEKSMIVISLILVSISMFFLEFTNYSLLVNTYKIGSPVVDRLSYLNTFLFSLMIIFFYFYYLTSSNYNNEKKLLELNKALSNSNLSLKKSNDELDSFVYKASHDLRSPLVSILGLIDLSKRESDLEKVRQYLILKEKSVKKLDSLILDILDLSKNARLAISSDLIFFPSFIKEIYEQYQYIESFDKITLNTDEVDNFDFYSDEKRLKIIFNNIISNSIRYADFSKDRPLISIAASQHENNAVITITDNGQGIKKEYFSRIFDMYFRANESRNGSGLGLYIVQETVNKLNGSIKLESEYGLWTKFTLTIPNNPSLKG